MSIAIATPTGHIGSALVRNLLAAGRTDLVLLLRDASKLDADVRERVETREGALQDPDYVRAATTGADALFWLSPPNWERDEMMGWYEALGHSAAQAVEANGIGHVVNLSSEGAQNHEAYGPVSGLGRIEAALDATQAAVRHLRPTFFFENFVDMAGGIREAGALFFPAPPDRTTGMIATADIARRAADLLLDLSWTGREIVPLYGPRDYSYVEAAQVLSGATGHPIQAQQVPKEATVGQMQQLGAPAGWAEGLADLYAAIGDDGYREHPRDEASTTPTPLSDWAREHLKPVLDA
jgi:uncharacterized protein YbjT (DUF2867 family)